MSGRPPAAAEPAFTALPDLASRRLGGGVIHASDEFFAAADNLVSAAEPAFEARSFGPKGQVYDGWETRRRREPGHDHAVVRLGAPGVVHGVVIDTAHFTGNHPVSAAVEGCAVPGHPSPAEVAAAEWVTLVPRSPLGGDARNPFAAEAERCCTHVRLSIHPDGGVARLRVHGEVIPDPALLRLGPVDLAALENGGRVIGCSDEFYGSPGNLLMPGLAATMGDGWETARRRDDGNDWVLVRLGVPGSPRLAELDTTHFKGNAPASARLRGLDARGAGERALEPPGDDAGWFDVLPATRLQPDTRHRFVLSGGRVTTHVRLDVHPDGGMARLRLYGPAEPDGLAALEARRARLLGRG